MGLLELIIVLSILMVAMSVGLLLLKFVFALVLLPFKLMFALTKGLLGLVFMVPLLLIVGVLLTAVVPLGLLVLLLPVIILGGIYGGVFTPTEAAAVAAVSPTGDAGPVPLHSIAVKGSIIDIPKASTPAPAMSGCAGRVAEDAVAGQSDSAAGLLQI